MSMSHCPNCGEQWQGRGTACSQGCLGSFASSTGSDATIKRLLAVLDGLIQECEYSATSGLPFNFTEGKGRWTQLENAKALLANLRQNDPSSPTA